MAVPRRSGRSRLTLVVLVLASISLLTVDGRSGLLDGVRDATLTVISPVGDFAGGVVAPVGDAWNGIVDYDDLERENDELRARIAALEGNQLRAVEAERERRELLALLGLDFVGDIPTVTARVTSGAPGNFANTVEIDAGSADGIRVDMPVTNGAGLVGKIVRTGRGSSIVRLITDPALQVGVRLATTGEAGVARGGGASEPLQIDFVDARSDVEVGEVVTTSGLAGSLFPAGIPVGTVSRRVVGLGRDQLEIDVEPAAAVEDLGFVQVLLWEAPEL